MVAEYRGLRTSIARRWTDSLEAIGPDELNELNRLHQAVDLSLAASVAWYHNRLARAQEQLRSADRAKDEFLTVLGHELRNPLSPLRTGLDLLEQARSKPELLDRVRPMMERQFSHLVRLVDDLLDLARISRGIINLQPARLDLNAAIEAAIEQTASLVEEYRHRLRLELSTSPLPVVGDFERLTQVVANLLSNACKYTEPGGSITVRSEAVGGAVRVSVRDTGYGIPADRFDDIFDFLVQVPEHRLATGGGGLGVGLAISRRLIEMHHGTIGVRSAGAGKGSEFIVTLPAWAGTADEEASEAPDAAGGRRRILVVDDNADTADSLRLMLEVLGHTVRAAYDGPSALQHVEQLDPDVVLLDLGLPGMDGFEVARRVRARSGGERVVLVAATGWGSYAGIEQQLEEAGFDGHLVKPIDIERIQRLLAAPRGK